MPKPNYPAYNARSVAPNPRSELQALHRLYELAVRDRARLREALEWIKDRAGTHAEAQCDEPYFNWFLDIEAVAHRALNETGADK